MSKPELRLTQPLVDEAIANALREDLGLAGDITTEATVSASARAAAVIGARQPGIVAGLQLVETAFKTLDPDAGIDVIVADGSHVDAGAPIARVTGNARALLTAERVAMNFLGHLSGIATLTRRYVDAVKGTRAHIIDTRKTTPTLRAFEKLAVRAGGGLNHRFGLFDAVLVKDNHIVASGGIGPALERVRARAGHMVKIEVEVTTLAELEEALGYAPDAVLLDNMPLETLRQAVALTRGRALTEASGGITPANVRAVAETGVDVISLGWLTHSAPAADVAFDL